MDFFFFEVSVFGGTLDNPSVLVYGEEREREGAMGVLKECDFVTVGSRGAERINRVRCFLCAASWNNRD